MTQRYVHIMVRVAIAALVFGACTPTAPPAGDSTLIASSEFTSPLDEFLGQSVWNNQEEFQRASDEFTVRREELIASCMRDAGFTYHPDLNSTAFTVGTNAFDDVRSNDREWIVQYGFGIASGHRHRSGGTIFDGRDDPNQEYVAGLSDTARAAYLYALNGSADSLPASLVTQADWDDWMSSRGCFGQALVQAQSESPLFLRQNDEFASLISAVNALNQSIFERPELAVLDQEWAHCMADAGRIGLRSPGDAESPFWNEYFSISFEIMQKRTEGTPSPDDGAGLLAELRAREIEVALDDFECRSALNYDARVNAIRLEMETQFVNDNRTLLEDFRNAAESIG